MRGTAHHIHPLMRSIKEGHHIIVHLAGGGVIPGIVQASSDTGVLVLGLPNGNNPQGRAEIMVSAIGAITHGLASEPKGDKLAVL